MILNKQIQKNIRIMFGEDAQDRTQRVLKRLRDDKAKDEHIPGSLTLIGRCAVDHAAADIIEQLDAQVPRWIPVEERMPLPHEDVAIIIRQGGYTYLRVGWYGCACQWMQAGLGMIEGEVTHWMPLPEPPKGKSPVGGNSDDFVHGNHGR